MIFSLNFCCSLRKQTYTHFYLLYLQLWFSVTGYLFSKTSRFVALIAGCSIILFQVIFLDWFLHNIYNCIFIFSSSITVATLSLTVPNFAVIWTIYKALSKKSSEFVINRRFHHQKKYIFYLHEVIIFTNLIIEE